MRHLARPERLECGYVTTGRIGGELKSEPEDFEVEEIPAYEPSGEGEHLFLWVEKRDVSADFLQSQLASRLQIDRSTIGMAGLKDRRAVTRQWISVPASCEGGCHGVAAVTDSLRRADDSLRAALTRGRCSPCNSGSAGR